MQTVPAGFPTAVRALFQARRGFTAVPSPARRTHGLGQSVDEMFDAVEELACSLRDHTVAAELLADLPRGGLDGRELGGQLGPRRVGGQR